LVTLYQAKRRGISVVFALHNFAYHGADFFSPVDAVLVPSRFEEFFGRVIGSACVSQP
jgi:hypothetical protein